jgi:PAS domain S-box-containing protein
VCEARCIKGANSPVEPTRPDDNCAFRPDAANRATFGSLARHKGRVGCTIDALREGPTHAVLKLMGRPNRHDALGTSVGGAGDSSFAADTFQQGVRQSNDALALLVSAIEDYAIFMLDPSGHVATWNWGAERIKGWLASEIIGKHYSQFYLPEDVAAGKPARLLREAEQVGRVEDEGWRIRKDGTRFWADIVITAIYDREHRLYGFAKVTRDLTERRAAEQRVRDSEERFRLLVDGVRDSAIFMLDPSGCVQSWNVGAERIKGYRASEIIGQHCSRFYPDEDVQAGKCERDLVVAARDGHLEDEGWRVRKGGTKFWASVIVTAVRDASGELRGFAKVTRDLTLVREIEGERLRRVQAEEAIRLRDEFLSIASHELKTPLTALLLQLQSLRERVDALDAKIINKVDRATESSGRLANLVETLLDVSRITARQWELTRQRVDLVQIVGAVVEAMQTQARGVGSSISMQAPPSLEGDWDRVRLEQIVTNLLSNAIKYGRGSSIRVLVEENGDEVAIEVSDGGPGIAEEDLARIFGRFERSAPMRNYGGLGLGLYVAREIAEAHGGVVRASNLPGGGASFRVRLPRWAPASDKTTTPSAG